MALLRMRVLTYACKFRITRAATRVTDYGAGALLQFVANVIDMFVPRMLASDVLLATRFATRVLLILCAGSMVWSVAV